MNLDLPSTAGYNRKHVLFTTWWSMILRCKYPGVNKYQYYGARGIRVCDKWLDFHTFLEDMGPRPHGYQLDRIDSDGNYEPDNCRWIPAKKNRGRHARSR